MDPHDSSRPWAAETPRLALTWVMTDRGLRMRWTAPQPQLVLLGAASERRARSVAA